MRHLHFNRATMPFMVGKTYRRADGEMVTCIKVTVVAGYECAQFDDGEETYSANVQHILDNCPEMLAYVEAVNKKTEPWNRSGWRYNRDADRGRCTGTAHDWSDNLNVWPEMHFAVGDIVEFTKLGFIHQPVGHRARVVALDEDGDAIVDSDLEIKPNCTTGWSDDIIRIVGFIKEKTDG